MSEPTSPASDDSEQPVYDPAAETPAADEDVQNPDAVQRALAVPPDAVISEDPAQAPGPAGEPAPAPGDGSPDATA